MALKLSVKIGDVTNLSDARYAAGMGVDYIGFNIDSTSENFITPKKFKEIVNWISGVGIIGEIGNLPVKASEDYPTYLVESTNPQIINSAGSDSIYRIVGTDLTINAIEAKLKSSINPLFFVLETSQKQLESNLAVFTNLCAQFPIYLSTTFNEGLLEKVVNTIKPKGIEIKGGLEDQPGFKDYDGIADVLEWLEEED